MPASRERISRGHKALHLQTAGRLGFRVPPTLVTNDPAAFLDFYREHDGHIVSKRAGWSRLSTAESPFVRYTDPVSRRDVGYAQTVSACPMIFQAYVDKQFEIRVTVVGKQAFAAQIDSQAARHSKHDWRRYDHGFARQTPHVLPEDVAGLCVRLVEELGLNFGAIDLVLTPGTEYVFLEINPNGQYLWVEYATGLPISEAVCEELIRLAEAEPRPG